MGSNPLNFIQKCFEQTNQNFKIEKKIQKIEKKFKNRKKNSKIEIFSKIRIFRLKAKFWLKKVEYFVKKRNFG